MPIPKVKRLRQRLRQTPHISVGVPEKGWQRCFGLEGISLFVVGHHQPVDAPDILPPPQYLTNKPLCGSEAATAVSPCALDLLANRQWLQQSDIEIHRYQGMKQPGRLLSQAILVRAEQRQGMLAEPVELSLRVFVSDGVTELRQIARVIGKGGFDLGQCSACDRITRYCRPLGDRLLRSPAFAVVTVVIPFVARGFTVRLQQHAVTLAHLAVKELHTQLFAPLSPSGKVRIGAEKAGVFKHLHGDSERLRPRRHGRLKPVLTGLAATDRVRATRFQGIRYCRFEGGFAICVLVVDDGEACGLQPFREVSHRSKDKCDLVTIMADIGRFLGHFSQQ